MEKYVILTQSQVISTQWTLKRPRKLLKANYFFPMWYCEPQLTHAFKKKYCVQIDWIATSQIIWLVSGKWAYLCKDTLYKILCLHEQVSSVRRQWKIKTSKLFLILLYTFAQTLCTQCCVTRSEIKQFKVVIITIIIMIISTTIKAIKHTVSMV